MTSPIENASVTDAAAANFTPAVATTDLTPDWLCDIDGARLNVIGRHQVGVTKYEIRECSSNPDHVKHQPV